MHYGLERLADRLGRLSTGLVVVGGAFTWILINVGLSAAGIAPIEKFPFHWLQRVILLSNIVMLFIIARARRQRHARILEQISKLVAASSTPPRRRGNHTEH